MKLLLLNKSTMSNETIFLLMGFGGALARQGQFSLKPISDGKFNKKNEKCFHFFLS